MIITDDLKTNPASVFLENYPDAKTYEDFSDLCEHMRKYHNWSNEELFALMFNEDLIKEW